MKYKSTEYTPYSFLCINKNSTGIWIMRDHYDFIKMEKEIRKRESRRAMCVAHIGGDYYIWTRRSHRDHGCRSCICGTLDGECRYRSRHEDLCICALNGNSKWLIKRIHRRKILWSWHGRRFTIIISKFRNPFKIWFLRNSSDHDTDIDVY